MGEFQSIHKYFTIFVAVLVVVACNGSLFAHGRQIKPLFNQQHSPLNTSPTVLAPLRTSLDTPIVPKYKFAADADSGDSSGANHANAFRPTTPGNSPGVGHKKFGEDNKGTKVIMGALLVHSPDVKVSVAEGSFENDFRPTDPGHSPGVGHPHQNKIN